MQHWEREPPGSSGLVGQKPRVSVDRRIVLGALGVAALSTFFDPSESFAEDVVVPVAIQIKLLVKVAGYDKNMTARAKEKVHVLVASKPKDADAARVASQAVAAFSEHDAIAGLPFDVTTDSFTSADALKKLIAKKGLSIVYLAPGLTKDEVTGVAGALDGVDVMTATASPTDVPRGVVLGFDLVSSKPKLLVHLGQAKKQKVALSSDVLKLAKVFE